MQLLTAYHTVYRRDRLTIPRPQDEITFTKGVGGFPKLLILVSKELLRQALSAMQSIARGRGQSRGTLGGLQDDEPIDIFDRLLSDLDNISRSASQPTGTLRSRNTNLVYNTASLSMLSASFEVIA